MSEDEKVGYGRPPRQHRFQPGKSGNPKGRPKGARSLSDQVRAALRQTVTINDGTRRRKITAVEAALRRLVEQSLKGDLRAVNLVLALAETYGLEGVSEKLASEDEALIASAMRRLGLAPGEEE